MTWSNLTSTGSGTTRYAVVISGWPEIFTSDPSVTLASWSSLQTRTVVKDSLLLDGLEFSERLIPQDGISEASGMTFTLRSPSAADEVMQSFTDFGELVTELGADLAHNATTATYSGPTPSTSTYYHVGSEVILTGSPATTITRGRWNTDAQTHSLDYFDQTQTLDIWDRPFTMDGRRIVLYAWGRGDDGTDIGTAIWRGVVTRPPMLDSDGVTWIIQADNVTALLNQTVVGHDVEAKIVGYYHHKLAPVIVGVDYNGSLSALYFVEGLHQSHAELQEAINTQLDAAMTELSVPTTAVANVSVIWDSAEAQWEVRMLTGTAAATDFFVTIGSPLIGVPTPVRQLFNTLSWYDSAEREVDYTNLANSTTYKARLAPSPERWEFTQGRNTHRGNEPTTAGELSFPAVALGGPQLTAHPIFDGEDTSSLTESQWRIYVDQDLSSLVGEFVIISDSRADVPFEVSAAGTANSTNYIEVLRPTTFGQVGSLAGFLGPDTTITPLVSYGNDDLSGFLSAVIEQARDEGNNGIAPYFQLADWENDGSDPSFTVLRSDTLKLDERDYAFARAISIRDVLKGELLTRGHILRLNSTGQLSLAPMPLYTAGTATDKTLTATEIIEPAGSHGSWPGYEIQAQGLVNMVALYDGYKPRDDEWELVINHRDVNSVAAHKNRGRGDLEIKLYSRSSVGNLTVEESSLVAGRLFTFLGRTYAAIKVEVPFNRFDYLVGDVVKLTHNLIPDGTGSRGVTSRRAVVIGRRWNLDPSREEWGELTLWMLQDVYAGYAPAAAVTSQVNDSGDTWTITCDSANALNVALSQNNDGKVLNHYVAGDYVQVSQRGTTTETVVTGTVDSVDEDNDTVTVTFGSTWTPGSNSWVLEFQTGSGSTVSTNQAPFAYVADSGKLLYDGTTGEKFA